MLLHDSLLQKQELGVATLLQKLIESRLVIWSNIKARLELLKKDVQFYF